MSDRVVITGLGPVSPNGIGKDKFWNSLTTGTSGIDTIQRFDASGHSCQIAGEVNDFEPSDYADKKDCRRMDRFTQFAVAGSKIAIEDSEMDLDNTDRDRVGVYIGSGIGGLDTLEKQHTILMNKGPSKVSPFLIPMMIGNMAAGQVSIQFGFRGPSMATVTACATAAHSIGEAFEALVRGDIDVAIAGGAEAAVTSLSLAGFCSLKAVSTRNNMPQRASRPFDRGRDGFILAEGAGVIILESEKHARNRGARIYCELSGYGASADAYHIVQPAPSGEGAVLAMNRALQRWGGNASDIGYINAHGTSTKFNDKLETAAIRTVFEDANSLAVSSTKSMTGHLLGAAGGIEAIACALAISEEELPPTINLDDPDPECDLDYIPHVSRKAKVDAVLSNSLAFGGQNASLIFTRA